MTRIYRQYCLSICSCKTSEFFDIVMAASKQYRAGQKLKFVQDRRCFLHIRDLQTIVHSELKIFRIFKKFKTCKKFKIFKIFKAFEILQIFKIFKTPKIRTPDLQNIQYLQNKYSRLTKHIHIYKIHTPDLQNIQYLHNKYSRLTKISKLNKIHTPDLQNILQIYEIFVTQRKKISNFPNVRAYESVSISSTIRNLCVLDSLEKLAARA